MTYIRSLGAGLVLLAGLWGVAFCAGAAPARAADLELKAQLLWGTDDQKPKDATFKELDPKIKRKLGAVFKWKNYFEIKAQKILLPGRGAKKVRMSPKCELELKLADEATLEVKLFGEGRWTKTVRQPVRALRQGELAVLAGDDKDKYGDAWFVVITAPASPER
jgi:hypothetical protein